MSCDEVVQVVTTEDRSKGCSRAHRGWTGTRSPQLASYTETKMLLRADTEEQGRGPGGPYWEVAQV